MNRTISLVLCVSACAPQPFAPETLSGLTTHRLIEGSPEAIGLLAFLNDTETTFDHLDDVVRLDARAAAGLIHHRNGPDGRHGTYDDNRFDTVAEVDDVRYVGPRTLEILTAWVNDNGWVATGDDLVSWFDGVPFTAIEAEATLRFVNGATADRLDHDLGLDSRAVASILDAQPVPSIGQLADLYYVGQTALQTLKGTAMAMPGATCDDSVLGDSFSDLADTGIEVSRSFTWQKQIDELQHAYDVFSQSCFGIDAQHIVSGGEHSADLRPAEEVVTQFLALGGSSEASDELRCQLEQRQVFGCHLSYAPDPWSGVDEWFYVTDDGQYEILFRAAWSE